MVLQDTFLFNGTVYENIVYGWKEATREDAVVVLDGTGIAEMGTHDELLARGGIFARLHGAQASQKEFYHCSKSDLAHTPGVQEYI